MLNWNEPESLIGNIKIKCTIKDHEKRTPSADPEMTTVIYGNPYYNVYGYSVPSKLGSDFHFSQNIAIHNDSKYTPSMHFSPLKTPNYALPTLHIGWRGALSKTTQLLKIWISERLKTH